MELLAQQRIVEGVVRLDSCNDDWKDKGNHVGINIGGIGAYACSGQYHSRQDHIAHHGDKHGEGESLFIDLFPESRIDKGDKQRREYAVVKPVFF